MSKIGINNVKFWFEFKPEVKAASQRPHGKKRFLGACDTHDYQQNYSSI